MLRCVLLVLVLDPLTAAGAGVCVVRCTVLVLGLACSSWSRGACDAGRSAGCAR